MNVLYTLLPHGGVLHSELLEFSLLLLLAVFFLSYEWRIHSGCWIHIVSGLVSAIRVRGIFVIRIFIGIHLAFYSVWPGLWGGICACQVICAIFVGGGTFGLFTWIMGSGVMISRGMMCSRGMGNTFSLILQKINLFSNYFVYY